MKIVYLYNTIAIKGGVERIFVDKMNYLADKLNHEVYLLTSSQGEHPVSFQLSPNVRHIDLDIRHHIQYQYSLPKRLWIRFRLKHLGNKRLKEAIAQIDPDIIICTTTYLSIEVCRLKCRAKKVIESHMARDYTHLTDNFKMGFFKDLKNRFNTYRRFRIIEKESDALVVLTQADAKAWKNAPNVYVIPNSTRFIPPQSSLCQKHRVIAIGRLTYQKGFDRLIDAWSIVNRQHPKWKLDIFGEGILHKRLVGQIKDKQLEKTVTIHSFTENIQQEYFNSSIFTLSSNYEGFVLVLLEAMGCGLPCVAFDCPNGPSEVIKNGENGFLVKNGNIEEFAAAVCYLIEHEDARKKIGKKSKETIQCYSPEIIMPQWERLFNTLLEK